MGDGRWRRPKTRSGAYCEDEWGRGGCGGCGGCGCGDGDERRSRWKMKVEMGEGRGSPG